MLSFVVVQMVFLFCYHSFFNDAEETDENQTFITEKEIDFSVVTKTSVWFTTLVSSSHLRAGLA